MDTQLEEVENIEESDVQPEISFPEGEEGEEEQEISEEHRRECYKQTQAFLREISNAYEKQSEKTVRDISALQDKWKRVFVFMQDERCRQVLDREIAIMSTQVREIAQRSVKTNARINLYDFQQSLFDLEPDAYADDDGEETDEEGDEDGVETPSDDDEAAKTLAHKYEKEE